jgi:hypothetical protein
MEIMTSYDDYTHKEYNALNDVRVEGSYTFDIKSGTYFMFTYDLDARMWIYQPRKYFYEMNTIVMNDSVLVRIPTPEEEGCEGQPMLRDMSNMSFAKSVLKMFDHMAKCPAPASTEKLRKTLKMR